MILRFSPFRISVAFALLVIIVTSGVFAFVYWDVSKADISQVRGVLEDEAARAASIPAEEIKGQLALRLTHDLRRIDYVGLFTPEGVPSYGNMGAINVPIDGLAHLTNVAARESDETEPAIFVARRRADGGVLVLGRSLREVHHIQAAMRSAFLAAVLPIVVIALATGMIVSYRASRRLLAIQVAIRRVMQGELAVRLPVRRSKDDINALANAVNSMLDEIVRLVTQIKSVGDNIAHDLKAPLAIMRIRFERACHAESFDLLQRTVEEALIDLDRALAIVSALLRISELETGLRRAAFSRVDISEICRDVFDMFEPLATEKNIDMTLDVPSSLPMSGDEDLLREAVANLIDNAIKFTPKGGSITLQCNRNGALIRVSDTGPGISPDEREKIFNRFYRSREAMGSPGFGLGLNMAATIAELHGCTLRAAANAPGAVFEWVPSQHRVEAN
ncbi:MAG: HAMP domain-containing sensor histidine kinase [Beijerinckiaceae bacterium]|nr:HAMP domain-containing sensor histidine kinase [Beijerinckiaceae bacterium]